MLSLEQPRPKQAELLIGIIKEPDSQRLPVWLSRPTLRVFNDRVNFRSQIFLFNHSNVAH